MKINLFDFAFKLTHDMWPFAARAPADRRPTFKDLQCHCQKKGRLWYIIRYNPIRYTIRYNPPLKVMRNDLESAPKICRFMYILLANAMSHSLVQASLRSARRMNGAKGGAHTKSIALIFRCFLFQPYLR